MDLFLLNSSSPRDKIQGRLLVLAAAFLCLFALVLTLSPAARLHTWAAPYRWEHWAGWLVWLAGMLFVHRQSCRLLPDRDPYLLPVAGLLSGWGLLTVWRLNMVLGIRQTIWLAFSLALLWAGMRAPDLLGKLRRYKYLELVGGLLLTALTFIFGTYPGGDGPHLWLGFGGIYLQPSEPLKLLLIIYLAAYLADRMLLGFRLMQLLAPTLVLAGAALVILLAQRDLGTATLFIFLYSLVVYLASGRKRILVIAGASILVAAVAGYQLFDVIRIRVNAWTNPWLDPAGRSYQIVQSLISIASGGVFGTGPGMGSPTLVPVAHSDFIFTAIAEETGMIGTFALLGLIALLAGRGLRAALHATNSYQRYLAAGLSAYLSAQGILIIAGNLRLLPLTGVTLPFVSYGGSSLVTSFLSILVLLLVSHTDEEEPAPLPSAAPYVLTGSFLLAGLVAIALANGWWGYVRADDLRTRADNPRRFVTDRYVKRGALLDRNNRPIDVTEGESGSYTRRNLYTPLAATVGYTNPIYGQTGLEATQDGYLRGIQGSPTSTVLTSSLLYNQPPPGLNVRTTIDLQTQELADQALGDHRGAIVLINARTGEVLVIASHPYFDPNQIEQKWDTWLKDQNAPLLNRATQGQYSPGTATGPFLLAMASSRGQLPPLPALLSFQQNGKSWNCALPPPPDTNWTGAVANGCPGALIALAQPYGVNFLDQTFRLAGFYQQPLLPIPGAAPVPPRNFQNPELAALGEENLQVTPMQMALAAAELSTSGMRPNPVLVTAVQTPEQGWVVLPAQTPQQSLPANGASTAAHLLAAGDAPYWDATGSGLTATGHTTWYLGGSLPDTQGTPLSIAVLLEEDNPSLARQIGRGVLQAALQP